uniref:Uncharacterized protein n=1 Tax=Arion vulgaris TaxID=1028688 RepID=A0A0B7AYI8_9EUPU
MCLRVHEMTKEFTARIRCLKMELKSRDLTLFNGESWELLIRRWAKLEKDFRLKNGRFDISKIPDIYDCIKYDLHYNQKTLQFKRAQELFMCSKASGHYYTSGIWHHERRKTAHWTELLYTSVA